MANEIWHSYADGNTLYALIWRKTDDKIYDVVAGSDTFDVYADADIDTYDLPMTAAGTTGDYYSVDFPSGISAGVYRVSIMKQDAGSPHVDNDVLVAQGEIYWNGTAEVDLYTLESDLDVLVSDVNVNESAIDVIKSDLTVVDSNVDAVLSDLIVADSNIDSLLSDLTIVDSGIDTIKSDLVIVDSNIDTNSSDLTVIDSNLDAAVSDINYVQDLLRTQQIDWGDGGGGGGGGGGSSGGSIADFGGGSGC